MMTASIIATSFIPSPASPPGAAGFGGEVAVLEEIKRLCIIFLGGKEYFKFCHLEVNI